MDYLIVFFGAVALIFNGISSNEACHVAYRRVSGHKESMIQSLGKCMSDSAGKEFRWEAIIRFSIEDSNWYFYVSNTKCSRGKDTDECWEQQLVSFLNPSSRYFYHVKRCIKEFTRQETSFTAHLHSNSAALAGEQQNFPTNYEATTIENTQRWVTPTPTRAPFISEDYIHGATPAARTGRGKRNVNLSSTEKLLLLLAANRQQAIRSGVPSQQPTYTSEHQYSSLYSRPTTQSIHVERPAGIPQYYQPGSQIYQPNPKVQSPQIAFQQSYNYQHHGGGQMYTNPQHHSDYNANQQQSNGQYFFQQQSHGNNMYETQPPPFYTTADPFVHILQQHYQPVTTSTPPITATNSPMSKYLEFLKEHRPDQNNANGNVNGMFVPPVVTGAMCDEQVEEKFRQCALSGINKDSMQRRLFSPNINPLTTTDMTSIFSFFVQHHSGCTSPGCTRTSSARSASAATPTCLPTIMLNLVKNDSKMRNIFLKCVS